MTILKIAILMVVYMVGGITLEAHFDVTPAGYALYGFVFGAVGMVIGLGGTDE